PEGTEGARRMGRVSGPLQPIPLESPVERAPAQTQRLGGLTDVAVEAGHGFLDQEALDFLEAHILEPSASLARRPHAEIALTHERPLRHQHGTLDGVIELADVARPAVLEQELHGTALETGQSLAIALRVLTQEMLRQQR